MKKVSREKAARVSVSGLFDPTLGYPARSPASWRRRSEFYKFLPDLGRLLGKSGATIDFRRRLSGTQVKYRIIAFSHPMWQLSNVSSALQWVRCAHAHHMHVDILQDGSSDRRRIRQ